MAAPWIQFRFDSKPQAVSMERGEEDHNGAILTPLQGSESPSQSQSTSWNPCTGHIPEGKQSTLFWRSVSWVASTKDQQLTFIEHLLCAWPGAKPFPLYYLMWFLIAQGAGHHYYSHFSDEETGVSCGWVIGAGLRYKFFCSKWYCWTHTFVANW